MEIDNMLVEAFRLTMEAADSSIQESAESLRKKLRPGEDIRYPAWWQTLRLTGRWEAAWLAKAYLEIISNGRKRLCGSKGLRDYVVALGQDAEGRWLKLRAKNQKTSEEQSGE